MKPSLPRAPGLRAQLALALLAVLILSASLAFLAVKPLVSVSIRAVRQRAALSLSRAMAGQIALLSASAPVTDLVADTVGNDAFQSAAMITPEGHFRAAAGRPLSTPPRPPFVDQMRVVEGRLQIAVMVPGRGAFVSETSLEETHAERALWAALLLYTGIAALAALGVIYAMLTRVVVQPVEALTQAAERVAQGRREVRAEPRGAAELLRAASAFNTMSEQLAARESELSHRIEELERTTREPSAAQAQLVRSERLAVVGRLAAGIAHEVGNPLAAIVGLTEVLKDGGLDESENRDFADRIGKEAQRIHRTIRELLDYARASPTVHTPTEALAGSVHESVQQVVRLLEPQKAFKELRFTVELPATLPLVRVSSDQLVQLLLNLVLNAIDALRDDPCPHTDGAEIRLSARSDGAMLTLELEDNGPGIPLELRDKIFEPFFTTKPRGLGSGLGLAICTVLVEQGGGTLQALDRHDHQRGTRITVQLPTLSEASTTALSSAAS